LDGTRRIDILAFPLAGLLAWNLFVYLWIVAGAFERRARGKGAAGRPWARAYSALAMLPLRSLLTRSTRFNAPLAEGLRRFADEWRRVAGPRLAARAARLFHLAAAMVAVGLVGGLYVRGIVWH